MGRRRFIQGKVIPEQQGRVRRSDSNSGPHGQFFLVSLANQGYVIRQALNFCTCFQLDSWFRKATPHFSSSSDPAQGDHIESLSVDLCLYIVEAEMNLDRTLEHCCNPLDVFRCRLIRGKESRHGVCPTQNIDDCRLNDNPPSMR